jgi:hypothetical protein
MTIDANTINLDAMILPDSVLHAGDEAAQAKLAAMRREILKLVAAGQIRFVIAAGVKFKLEPWS